MLKKLISCGRPGACRAALDAAVKLGIPCLAGHAGVESRPSPASRPPVGRPQTVHDKKALEKSVREAAGSLIFARGSLTADGDFTRVLALKHRRQLLAIDLGQTSPLEAASLISSWIKLYRIDILHVIGPGEHEDALIYGDVLTILEAAYYQSAIEFDLRDALPDKNMDRGEAPAGFPSTVEEAIDRVSAELSFGDKCRIANMKKENLGDLGFTVGNRFLNEFRLAIDNAALLESCREVTGSACMTPKEASSFLLKFLWRKLREGNVLKVVK
jgi:hypothetical protein